MVVNEMVASLKVKPIELRTGLVETRRRESAKGVGIMVDLVREVGDADGVERARQKTYGI